MVPVGLVMAAKEGYLQHPKSHPEFQFIFRELLWGQ
jgi:hypothetical protein